MRFRMSVGITRIISSLAVAVFVTGCAGMAGFGDSPGMSHLRAQAESGDAASQHRMGLRYTNGVEVSQDYAAAADWFRKAAGQGHVGSQYFLGMAYYTGRGVAWSYGEGMTWLEKAALQGHAQAQGQLGDAYANGRGVVKEPEWGIRWTERSARAGYVDAQFTFGVSLISGIGVTRNTVSGTAWLVLAGRAKHKLASDVLKEMEQKLSAADLAQARRLADGWRKDVGVMMADRATLRFVQAALSVMGFKPGPADGLTGPKTKAAIRSFAASTGLATGDAVTPELIERLRRDLREKPGA